MSLFNIHHKHLIVDIGNSTISFGVFTNGEITDRLDVESNLDNVITLESKLSKFIKDKGLYLKDFKGGLISSVVPNYTKTVKEAVLATFEIELETITEEHYKSVKMLVKNPLEVGQDLLADVKAANVLYGGACIIIDLGTITKNLVIDKDGTFIGTSFFPGVQICMDVMRDKTAQLPGFRIDHKPEEIIGNDTIAAMQSGVYYGTVCGVKSLADEIENKVGYPLKRILTGGNSHIIGESLPEFIIDKDFVLKGIYFLYTNR